MENKEENNFEKAMLELENIANDLERGNLTLDESVKKFEEGMKLSKQCTDILEKAEKRINILINNGEEIKEEKFTQNEE